jgi:hypothetical protein
MGTIILIIIAIVIISLICRSIRRAGLTPEQRAEEDADLERRKLVLTYGPVSPAMICPHCQTRGYVSTIPQKRKKGISGAKATGALLTMGVSMLATGLSRKETMTQAHCGNCNATWDF